MHDWTLLSILFDWKLNCLSLHLLNMHSEPAELIAKGVRSIFIPHNEEWGASQSIYEISDLLVSEDGNKILKITIQSGDIVEITAKEFQFPEM